MKIVFNPFFSGSPYINESTTLLNTKVCGPAGLISELELRLGLYTPDVNQVERVIRYEQALVKALQADGSLFYKDSLDTDSFMTAKVLLSWRDAIKRLGWKDSMDKGEKLKGLSAAEKYFIGDCALDRLQRILTLAAEKKILDADDEIFVLVPKDRLEMPYVQLFDAMEVKGVKVVYEQGECVVPKCDEMEFASESEAYRFICSQTLDTDNVAVGFKNNLLNDYMYLAGKPGIASFESGIGAIMSVFYLGLSLFSKPVDMVALLSYLQLHSMPLNQLYIKVDVEDGEPYYRSLNKSLADCIVSDGGIDDGWHDCVAKAIYDHDGKRVPDAKRERILGFIGMWDKSSGNLIDKKHIEEFAESLGAWAQEKSNPSVETFSQYQAVKKACQLLILAISNKPQQVKLDDVKLLASKLCEPVELSSVTAKIGSANTVSGAEDIYSNVKDIYLLSTASNAPAGQLTFLSKAEQNYLFSKGVLITADDVVSDGFRYAAMRGLSRASGQIHIVSYKDLAGKKPVASSTVSEIICANEVKSVTSVSGASTTSVKVILSDKLKIHTVDRDMLNGFTRDESYSSIESLVQNPIDYILKYVLHYDGYGVDSMPDIDTLKGNLAHLYIETLGEKCDNDVTKMIAMHKKGFNTIIELLTEKRGMMLLQYENRIEYNSFKAQLERSVNILLGIISDAQLKIVGFEQELRCDGVKEIGTLTAKIDCVLQNNKGEYFIFDFKWNSGKTYENKIEASRDAQLSVYRYVVEHALNGKVVFCGYYLFPKYKMVTPDDGVIQSLSVVPVARKSPISDNGKIFNQLQNSYKFRREQISSGVLEEAQGLEVANLDYNIATDKMNLYPLDKDYYDESLKATTYGSKNVILYGGLK